MTSTLARASSQAARPTIEVPPSWTESRLSRHVRINEGLVDPASAPYSEMPLIAPNHIESGTGRILFTETASAQGAESGKYLVRAGQVIYSKIRPNLMKVAIAPFDCLCSADMYGIDGATRSVDNGYLKWFLLTREFTDRIVDSSLRSALPKVNRESLGASSFWFPSLPLQKRIAQYLDSETVQIDELISKQERLIELLAEKRKAIITHAFTKGLDPNAPTKFSGISWLGHIPETWRTAELKRVITFITSGSRGWAEFYADRGTPFVRIGNLTRGHLHLDMSATQYVEIPRDAEGTRAVVKAGDVLLSITAYLGSVAVASEKEQGSYVSQHIALTRLDQNRLQSRFLAYFVLSESGQRQLNEGAYGGTKLQLSLEDIKSLWIPVPKTSEQIAITRHLDESTARIDALLVAARRSIALLHERRSVLISAAVTGKIEVEK